MYVMTTCPDGHESAFGGNVALDIRDQVMCSWEAKEYQMCQFSIASSAVEIEAGLR